MFKFLSRRSRPATRFVPRLESLDGRVLPGGLTGGVVLGTHGPAVCVRGSTEEIPQAFGLSPVGQVGGDVEVFGKAAGASGGNF